MAKLSFCILLLLATSHAVMSYNYAGSASVVSSNESASAIKCFADLLIPQALQATTTINDDFVEEIKTFIIRANPELFTQNPTFKACLARVSMTSALEQCKAKNNGNDCEVVDRIIAVAKCPSGMSRVLGTNGVDSTSCYLDCPAGFTQNGIVCEKPQTYVLNPYTNELECTAANGGKPCPIYHVRYFVPDCKENFYRLGSSVCIPKCAKNFADYDTFCLRPELKLPAENSVAWVVSASNN